MNKNLGETHAVFVCTSQFTTGDAFVPSVGPTYSVRGGDGTEVVAGSMSAVAGETEEFYAAFDLTDENGFESGRTYGVFVKATVDGVSAHKVSEFCIDAAWDAPVDVARTPVGLPTTLMGLFLQTWAGFYARHWVKDNASKFYRPGSETTIFLQGAYFEGPDEVVRGDHDAP